jgi:DNA-binding IclR family transcriptional regulator
VIGEALASDRNGGPEHDAANSAADMRATTRIRRSHNALPPKKLDSTLCKGISILECLSESPRSKGVSEISAQLGINKSNVHRLLHSLIALGYVEQAADRSYSPTLKLWGVGVRVSENMKVATCSRDITSQLAERTSECVHLAVLQGLETFYIDKVEGPRSTTRYFRKGGRAPLHCTATGKLLLAQNYNRLRIAMSRRLEPRTSHSITTIDKLDGEIKVVLRNRFALNIEEMLDGINVLAAPIRDGDGRVVAAIGISGSNERLTMPRLMDHLDNVKRAAASISQRLS